LKSKGKVIKEAKRRYLEKQMIVAINKPKKMWDIINNEIGNIKFTTDNIEIKDGSNLLMNPQSIADKFNSHFIHSFIHLFACQKSFTSSEEQDTDYCPLYQ
jgi:hypothetical protein